MLCLLTLLCLARRPVVFHMLILLGFLCLLTWLCWEGMLAMLCLLGLLLASFLPLLLGLLGCRFSLSLLLKPGRLLSRNRL